MDMDALRKQIEARKQEARDKMLGQKAAYIVKVLGIPTGGVRMIGALPTWSYTSDSLTVMMVFPHPGDERLINTVIGYGEQVVFEEEGLDLYRCEVRAYIPGPWEKIFEEAYSQAVGAASKLHEAAKTDRDSLGATKLAEEAKKFGL